MRLFEASPATAEENQDISSNEGVIIPSPLQQPTGTMLLSMAVAERDKLSSEHDKLLSEYAKLLSEHDTIAAEHD